MRNIVFALFFWTGILCTLAQPRNQIQAKVTDHEKNPLVGAVVMVDGGKQHTLTNTKGIFTIERNSWSDYTIEIQFLGYNTFKMQVSKASPLPREIALTTAVEFLGEVTVRDNRTAQRQREQAQASEMATDADLRANLSGSLMTTLAHLPGVGALTIGSGQSKPMIRGLGFNRVVVVDNGIKHEAQQWGADHGLEIDQYGVESVEVIKGPASILYGPDAIGGVVNLSNDRIPGPHTTAASVDLTAQSVNRLWGASLAAQARGQRLFFKARATITDYGDYRIPADSVTIYSYRVGLHNHQLRNTAGKERNFMVTAGWATPQWIHKTTVGRIDQTAGFFANAHGREPRNVDQTLHDRSDRDILDPQQNVVHWKAIHQTLFIRERFRAEAEMGYQHNLRQEWSPYIPHGYMPSDGHTIAGISQNLERQFDKHTYSANLKLQWQATPVHQISTGAQAELQDNRINGWSFIIPAFTQMSAGAYVYDKWELRPGWLLHSALRADWGQIDAKRYTDWFQTPVTDNNGTTVMEYLERAPNAQRRFGSIVWSLGTAYNHRWLGLKGNIGKSFRMPIAKELAANGVNYHNFSYEKGNIDLDPEISYQADLFAKATLPRFYMQVSPFYNYFPNYIYLNPTYRHDYSYGAGNQVYEYTQAKVVRYGGEFEAGYTWTSWLKTELTGEWVYSVQKSGEKKNFTLPFSPPPSMTATIRAEGHKAWQLESPYLAIDTKLAGAQNHIVPPEKKTDGYTTLNLSTGGLLRIGRQQVSINVKLTNLLNATYYNHTSFYRLIDLPEAGRSILVNIHIPISSNAN
ncbi:MAG: TonB-dependent receptor [Breznakibacter sp.]